MMCIIYINSKSSKSEDNRFVLLLNEEKDRAECGDLGLFLSGMTGGFTESEDDTESLLVDRVACNGEEGVVASFLPSINNVSKISRPRLFWGSIIIFSNLKLRGKVSCKKCSNESSVKTIILSEGSVISSCVLSFSSIENILRMVSRRPSRVVQFNELFSVSVNCSSISWLSSSACSSTNVMKLHTLVHAACCFWSSSLSSWSIVINQ